MKESFHPEDIKAELRKRHRTITAFEAARSLPARSVKDVLRGRSRPAVALAIANELGISVDQLLLFLPRHQGLQKQSPNGDFSDRAELMQPLKPPRAPELRDD